MYRIYSGVEEGADAFYGTHVAELRLRDHTVITCF